MSFLVAGRPPGLPVMELVIGDLVARRLISSNLYMPARLQATSTRLVVRVVYLTFPSLIKCCSHHRIHVTGQALHSHIFNLGHRCNTFIQSSLIFMYSTSVHIMITRRVFEEMVKGLPLMVKGVSDCMLFCTLPLLIFNVIILLQVGDSKTIVQNSLLWLHANCILCILCIDENNWLLRLFLVCPQDIFISENRLMRWWEGAIIRSQHTLVDAFRMDRTDDIFAQKTL